MTLVLDASGSMAWGNRVEIARAAAEAIRGGLREGDQIAVVQFSDNVLRRYTVRPTHPDDERVASVDQAPAADVQHERTGGA